MVIGSHVSFKKDTQLLGSVRETLEYKANTFMLYTGAPQNTDRLPIDDELTELAHNLMKKEKINIDNAIVHAPYIINLANPKNMDFNINFLKEELNRVNKLGIRKIVLHPGSHVGLGREEGIRNIISALDTVLEDSLDIIICLEFMAGKGTEIGSSLEDLRDIIIGSKYSDKLGVCLDTCHLNDAGIAIEQFDRLLEEFDQVIGISKLLVIHINDSKNNLASHKDRHENIGYGKIGFDSLLSVVNNPKIKDVPKILETPYIEENPPYRFEIDMLRSKKFNENLIADVVSYYKDCKMP